MTEHITGFRGKVVLVTGAGTGIGLAIAETFAGHGSAVVIAEIDENAGQNACKNLSSKTRCIYVQTDVADESAVSHAVQTAISGFGRLDYVINNAADAVELYTPVTELPLERWRRVLDVNLTGPMLMSKHAAPHLAAARGAIVNISSTRALMSEANTEAYSSTKAGLIGLTHSMAMSLAPNVRVNCISPGWIDTSAYRNRPTGTNAAITESDHKIHPVGRVGLPADIAEMALYLCSDAASFITGQDFIIDGGMTRKMVY
jgi:NAD(P)-dependent dehydrogenase (short-subunit alcohol dehydrogenase family)